MKSSLDFLQNFGLTENEIGVYELLLKYGEVPVSKIIQESQLKRPTTYKILYSLEKKGLASQKDIKGKINFIPTPPTQLLELANQQYALLDRSRKDLQSILPTLTSDYTKSVEQPIITIYEGVEGLKQIYLDTLIVDKPIYAVLQTEEVEPELYKWLDTSYVKERLKKKIFAKVIVATGDWSSEYVQKNEKQFRETKLVPREKFPFQHEVDIYGNKVAFINFKKGEPLIGVIIDHPLIAQTMKAWFDLAWQGSLSLKTKTNQ